MRRHAQSEGSCIPQRQQRGSSVPTSPGVGWEEPPGVLPPRLGPWGQGWCQAAVLGLELGLELGRTGTLLTVALWSFTREQARLKTSVVEEDTEEWQKDSRFTGLERVGGVDLSYIKGDDTSACASLVVLSYPALEVLYEDCRMVAVSAPYVAGFLAFREVPFLVEAVQRLQQEEPKLRPQVVLVDGNGLLHPRGFGVACHLGVLTDLPCIGVAKNLLHVDGVVRNELHREQIRSLQRGGDTFPLTGTSGRVLGMVLRSYNSSKPLYISVGHKVCLETAVRLVKSCCRYRIPEPIRQADIRSREYIRKQLCSPLEVVSSGPKSRKKEAELDD